MELASNKSPESKQENAGQLPWFLADPDPEIFIKGEGLTLDLETTVNSFGTPHDPLNRILCACWNFKGRNYSYWGGEDSQRLLLKHLQQADFIIAHNAKFELGWLRRCGLDLRSVIVWDTMLADWVLLGNTKGSLSLEACAARHKIQQKKDVVGSWIRSGVDTYSIPRNWLVEYCSIDVALTKELFRRQLVKVREQQQLHLVYQRGLVCACLTDIEFNGLCLDKERVETEFEKVQTEYGKARRSLEKYGTEINWRSRKQVAELLYDRLGFREPTDRRGNPIRTERGDRSVDKATIAALKASTKEQRDFVELYKNVANLNAKLTKSLEFFKGVLDYQNGIFFGIFNQGHTATHRLSSSGRPVLLSGTDTQDDGTPIPASRRKTKSAQFQNLPRDYKRLFTAQREGWLLLDADASQLEFRAAAELGDDNLARREIAEGADIHSVTAATLTAAGEPTSRQEAKPRTFRPLYGGSSGTPAEVEYCKFFQNKYKQIYKTQTDWTYEVLKTGKLVTPYGMRFYWPHTKMSRSGFIENTTAIFNFPVQGFATAEIIPLVLLSFWHRTKDLRCVLVNTVHDSIIAEVHPDDVDQVIEITKTAFLTDTYNLLEKLYNVTCKTQLGCEIKIGSHWGEGKGQKFEATEED